jgi:hypothetical protein
LSKESDGVKQGLFTAIKDEYQKLSSTLTPEYLRKDPVAYAKLENQAQNMFGTLLHMVTDQGSNYLNSQDKTWYESNIQNHAMGVAAGVGFGIGKNLVRNVNGTDRLSMMREARRETQASNAEAVGIEKTRVENNIDKDGGVDPYAPVPNAQSQTNIRDKAAVDEAAGTYNPHYDAKHGPNATTLQQQYERAMNGTNPQTGSTGRPADASKFFNSTDMETAIKQAEAAYATNPGAYVDGNVTVQFNRPIGEGYTGDTRQNRLAGIPVGEYRWSNTATVGIDARTGKAYTSYPNVTQGTPLPDPLKNGVIR